MNKQQFLSKYNFCIRAIQSCKTIDQFNSASKLSWFLIDRDWSVFDDFVWKHLRVIAIELDRKRAAIQS